MFVHKELFWKDNRSQDSAFIYPENVIVVLSKERFDNFVSLSTCHLIFQPAGTLADSLAQIFMLTTNVELRQQAYRMVGVANNRDFALAIETRLNEYFKSKQRKLDRRSACFAVAVSQSLHSYKNNEKIKQVMKVTAFK